MSTGWLLPLSDRLVMFAEEAAETGTVEDHGVLAEALLEAAREVDRLHAAIRRHRDESPAWCCDECRASSPDGHLWALIGEDSHG